MPEARRAGAALRGWLALTTVLQPVLPWHLKRRLKRGKEHPVRWREKLGYATQDRPEGKLVWLHAVGLGEVLALRGLIARLASLEPDKYFLVTSGTRASAEVFERNAPPNTIHQFAPLDAPGPARRFLQHWRPDLSIWAEQELWPGLVYRADSAGIPLALVNARMNQAAFQRRQKVGAVYRDILPRFRLISAQDDKTAEHLSTLGAPVVSTDGSLKLIAPPLKDDAAVTKTLDGAARERFVWLAASTHLADEALVLAAQTQLLADREEALLIIVPRLPARSDEIVGALKKSGLIWARRSSGQPITPDTQVYVADAFGELGVFYRLAQAAFIGGTVSEVEGHNPWEAAQLGAAILHGPRTANFASDYAALDRARAACMVETPDMLESALTDPELSEMARRALTLTRANMDRLDHLCQKLNELF